MHGLRLLYKFTTFFGVLCRCFGIIGLHYDAVNRRYYQRKGCLQHLLPVCIGLLILMHICVDLSVQQYSKLSSAAVEDIGMLLLLLWSLLRKRQLWQLLEQAQLAYDKLQTLLQKRCQCSNLLLLLMLLLLLLLLFVMLAKLLWFDWPPSTLAYQSIADGQRLLNYAQGLCRLHVLLIVTLHVCYFLLHAALLQTLSWLLQQQPTLGKQLKLLQQLLAAEPLLKRLNYQAASYFKGCLLLFCGMLTIKCSQFVGAFNYSDNFLYRQLSSLDDLMEESDWAGNDMMEPNTHFQLLLWPALLLAWHLALLLLLLTAARAQQRQHQLLANSIWLLQQQLYTKQHGRPTTCHSAEHTSRRSVLTFLLDTKLHVLDYQRGKVPFLAFKIIWPVVVFDVNCMLGSFKMLLFGVVGAGLAGFLEQQELQKFQLYLRQQR